MQFFKYIGGVDSLEDAATKMLAVGMAEDKGKSESNDDE
jgi:hypothetical protein